MQSEISRTYRAQKLLERYLGDRIQGYVMDDIKEAVSELTSKRAKSNERKRAEALREIRRLEREARAAVREVLLQIET